MMSCGKPLTEFDPTVMPVFRNKLLSYNRCLSLSVCFIVFVVFGIFSFNFNKSFLDNIKVYCKLNIDMGCYATNITQAVSIILKRKNSSIACFLCFYCFTFLVKNKWHASQRLLRFEIATWRSVFSFILYYGTWFLVDNLYEWRKQGHRNNNCHRNLSRTL